MKRSLIALALVGLVDSVSYMVVAPSIVFYVLQVGGTKEQYGLILSAFSFASFIATPILGRCTDVVGFRIPYFLALIVATLGGFVYLIAGNCPPYSLGLLVVGRLLGGCGAASWTLGFAYLAKAVPHDELTKTNSILSMVRMLGVAAGPGFNVFLENIDFDLWGMHFDNLNSVGFVLVSQNLLAFVIVHFFLDEPSSAVEEEEEDSNNNKDGSKDLDGDDENNEEHYDEEEEEEESSSSLGSVLRSCFSLGILVPLLSMFTMNANWKIIDTAFTPAAYHALGWGPVECSTVMGTMSFIIFGCIFIVFQLSSRKVKDEMIASIGLCLSIAGYAMIWNGWVWQPPSVFWNYVLPMFVACAGFPFLGGPMRSVYTKAVKNAPALRDHSGTMQALMSMAASVAGFTMPSFVAVWVLKHPEEVEQGKSPHRELTKLALFAPILSFSVLVGVALIQLQERFDLSSFYHVVPLEKMAEKEPDEETTLLATESDKEEEETRPSLGSDSHRSRRRSSRRISRRGSSRRFSLRRSSRRLSATDLMIGQTSSHSIVGLQPDLEELLESDDDEEESDTHSFHPDLAELLESDEKSDT